MKKYIATLVVAIAATSYSSAQIRDAYTLPTYAGDALRFSQTNYGSSARFKAMGNAQIGMGGDISTLGGNPAGLGFFTKSEFVFTPEFNATSSNTNYLNNNTTTTKNQLNLNQIGAVFHMPTYRAKGQDTQKGIVSAAVGIGYNRTNDYGLEAGFSGTNITSSVYNMFDGDNAYTEFGNKQNGSVMRSGSVSEFNLAGAINISNQIYIGANLGFVGLKVTNDGSLYEKGVYTELPVAVPAVMKPYDVGYFQNQESNGSGINGRLGIIFRPVNELRLGVNLQTPTWFTIDDTSSANTTDKAFAAETYEFTYNLQTPLKGSLGASYIFGNKGLLSADIDFVDYASIRFSTSDGNSTATMAQNNNEVKANYKSAINYRVGGEFKVTDLVSLRAGYGINGSAFKDDTDNYFQTQFYSGGLGYRNKNYYFDVAYQRVQTHSTFSPYLLQDYKEPVADVNNNKTNIFLTFGIRF